MPAESPKIVFSGHRVDFKKLRPILEASLAAVPSECRTFGISFRERFVRIFARPFLDPGPSPVDIMFIELLLCLAFTDGKIITAIGLAGEGELKMEGRSALYQKKVRLTENAYRHIAEWNDFVTVATFSSDPSEPKVPDGSSALQNEFTVYFFAVGPNVDPAEDVTSHIVIPLIHAGTLDFLESVTFSPPIPEFLSKLREWRNLQLKFDRSADRLLPTIFGSMVLGLYGVLPSGLSRPRDVDVLYPPLNVRFTDRFGEIVSGLTETESRPFDFYASGTTPDIMRGGVRACAMDRLFNYFQSTVNAGSDVIYVPNSTPDPNGDGGESSPSPFSSLPLQKIQTVGVGPGQPTGPGTGPRMLLTFSDMMVVPSYSVIAYGSKFLPLDLEIFGKHLLYLDRACGFEIDRSAEGVSASRCSATVPDEIVSDLFFARNAFTSGSIRPPESAGGITLDAAASLRRYLNYLGLDGEIGLFPDGVALAESLKIPLHYNALFTSVANERAYELWQSTSKSNQEELDARLETENSQSNVVRDNVDLEPLPIMITRPTAEVSARLEEYCRRSFVTKFPSKTPEMWRKTIVTSVEDTLWDDTDPSLVSTGGKIIPYVFDSYTAKTDALSGMVYTHQKIFRNVDLLSLPKTPIGSIYGDLPSTWIWVLTARGNLDVMLVTSGFELFNKHMALAYGTDRILAGGELRVQTTGDIIFSVMSGTYTLEILDRSADTSARYMSAVKTYFVLHLTQEWLEADRVLYFTDNDLVPVAKRPLDLELSLMCSGFTSSNRLYVHNPNVKEFYLSQATFDEVAGLLGPGRKMSERACTGSEKDSLTKRFKSVAVSLEDVETDELEAVGTYGYQIYADSAISIPSFGIATALASIVPPSTGGRVSTSEEGRLITSDFFDFESWASVKVLSSEEKHSASNTLVVLGKLDLAKLQVENLLQPNEVATSDTPLRRPVPTTISNVFQNYVALKISAPTVGDVGASAFEIEVYRTIYEKLIRTRVNYHVPSIIFGLVGYTDYNFGGWIPEAKLEGLESKRSSLRVNVAGAPRKLNVLMTEWITGKSLSDILSAEVELTEVDVLSIFFQVAWCVQQLAAIGVQQNDLHAGNVYVHRLGRPTYLSYFDGYSNKYYLLPARYLVKIYDFDQSVATNLGKNKLIGGSRTAMFSEAGIYNQLNTRFDLFTLLCVSRETASKNKKTPIFSHISSLIEVMYGTPLPKFSFYKKDGSGRYEESLFSPTAWPFVCRACGVDPTTKKCFSNPDTAEKSIPSIVPEASVWISKIGAALRCVHDFVAEGFPKEFLPPHDGDLVYFFGADAARFTEGSDEYRGMLQFAYPGKNQSHTRKLLGSIRDEVETVVDPEEWFV